MSARRHLNLVGLLAFVDLRGSGWSIASVAPLERPLMWWCGEVHEWVQPGSSYWGVAPDCWNQKFSTLHAARAFARKKGWA